MKAFRESDQVAEIEQRIRKLSIDSPRRWGKMTVSQMLCHLADSFEAATGKRPIREASPFWKRTGMKWTGLYLPLPWPAERIQTLPELGQLQQGTPPSEFASDIERLERSLRLFVESANAGRCGRHALFGSMSSSEWSRFGYLHADHHLRQFGA